MEIKVYHTGNSFEDLIAKYLIVVVKLLFKCGPVLPSHVLLEGIEEFGAKTYELFIKNQKFI